MEWPREKLFNGIDKPLTLGYSGRKPLFSRITSWSSGSDINSIMDVSDRRRKQLTTPNDVVSFSRGETIFSSLNQQESDSTDSNFTTESVESVSPAPQTEDVIVRQLKAEQASVQVDSPCLSNAVEQVLQSSGTIEAPFATGADTDFRHMLKSVAEKVKHLDVATRHGVRQTVVQSRGYTHRSVRYTHAGHETRLNARDLAEELAKTKDGPFNRVNYTHVPTRRRTTITSISQSCPSSPKKLPNSRMYKKLSKTKHMKSHQMLFGSEERDLCMSPHFVVSQATPDAWLQAAKASVHSTQGTPSVFPRRTVVQAEPIKHRRTGVRSSMDLSIGEVLGCRQRRRSSTSTHRKFRGQKQKTDFHTGDGFNDKGVQTDRTVGRNRTLSKRLGLLSRKSATPNQNAEFSLEQPSLPILPYTVYYCRPALDSTQRLTRCNSIREAEWNRWSGRHFFRSPDLSKVYSPMVSARPRRCTYSKRKPKSSRRASGKSSLWNQDLQFVEV